MKIMVNQKLKIRKTLSAKMNKVVRNETLKEDFDVLLDEYDQKMFKEELKDVIEILIDIVPKGMKDSEHLDGYNEALKDIYRIIREELDK